MGYVSAAFSRILNGFFRVVPGYFRRKRGAWFKCEFRDCCTVLDVGGNAEFWNHVDFPAQITLLNIVGAPDHLPPRFTYIRGDGRQTGLGSGSFDLVFSNSVIEHVGTLDDQRRFANELLRLGRRLYCQTPNKWFPIDPHFLSPFVHWLPLGWFTYFVHRYFTIYGLATKPDRRGCSDLLASIRLLNRKELAQLFPGCRIKTERFFGLPKSFVVFK